MAHSCPDCGLTCYCGGDIDDICFGDDSEEAMYCGHCSWKEQNQLDEFEDYLADGPEPEMH